LARIRGDVHELDVLRSAEVSVRAFGVESDAELGRFFHDPPSLAMPEALQRLRQMYDAGAWVILESAVADLPADLRWLYESGAVTLEQLAVLHAHLGITSVADLATAVQEHDVLSIEGFGEAIEQAISKALPDVRRSVKRIPLGRAFDLTEPILSGLRSLPGVEWVSPAGSLRRGQDSVGDIELLAAADDPAPVIETVAQDPAFDRVLHRSSRRLYVLTNRTQIGMRFPEPSHAGASLLHLTGSNAHFALLRQRAASRGWRLTPEGLRSPDGSRRTAATEEDIYAALDLPFIPPEIRDGGQEVAAAESGTLPRLVSREDIRGDLHMHSRWSDGRDSIEAMVAACRDLGYDYVAITDHSPTSGAIQTLSAGTVMRQAEEIAALRERFPQLTILHGCEVDILPRGRLDFPDHVLEQFDIVLASLHHRVNDGPEALLARYDAAARHPLVSLLTHPTNRVVPHRAGYDLDYDRLFAIAAETGTLLEIDGAPAHLDLDGALARRAVAAGTTVAISSDCHRADHLGRQMEMGIATARRGWVEPRHVVNARPLAGLLAYVARKRGG
jgi:DNA polymerase (family 10)